MLCWIGRNAKDVVDEQELQSAKVGAYDAVYFETMMPLRDGRTVRLRQWVFMVNNQCYLVISTIFPPYEERIFPGVQAMVTSFQIKKPSGAHKDGKEARVMVGNKDESKPSGKNGAPHHMKRRSTHSPGEEPFLHLVYLIGIEK